MGGFYCSFKSVSCRVHSNLLFAFVFFFRQMSTWPMFKWGNLSFSTTRLRVRMCPRIHGKKVWQRRWGGGQFVDFIFIYWVFKVTCWKNFLKLFQISSLLFDKSVASLTASKVNMDKFKYRIIFGFASLLMLLWRIRKS